jgi:biopolymer transport protein ExbD
MFRPPKREQENVERLNLIPIMDAVFIFIFFLLFSAQFIKIYEIASDAPIINEVPENEKLKKDPLNLIVKITEEALIITTGVDSNIYKTFEKINGEYDTKALQEEIYSLKLKNMDEKFAIVSPEAKIKYDDVVQVMDAVQLLPENKKKMVIEVNGKPRTLYKTFQQVVLEPIQEE